MNPLTNHPDEVEAFDQRWKAHRQWLIGVLIEGDTVHCKGRPLIGFDDVESEMGHDDNEREARLCCHRDETGAGALLAQAKKEAAARLVDRYERELAADMMGRPVDEDFFEYREAV